MFPATVTLLESAQKLTGRPELAVARRTTGGLVIVSGKGIGSNVICCVALLFYFIPNTEMRFRWVWPGAIVTGLLWRGALSAFSWYARDLAAWNAIHGSITTVVVFLFWVYISAVILLYGVEMTAAYARLQAAAVKRPELVKATA